MGGVSVERERLQKAARWIGRERVAPLAGVAAATACVLAATLLRLALDPVLGTGYSFVTYFLAVIVAAATTGVMGGATALAMSVVVAWYLFVPPARSFDLSPRDATAVAIFLLNAGLSGLVAAMLRRTLVALTRAEDRQQLLIHELNHRVKNTLATVQSLAIQTARTSGGFEEFQPLFSARLTALASAHDLLTRRNWEGAELGGLLREVAAPYDPDGMRIGTTGPPVALSPNTAVTLSLALHELVTNAVKHGALAGQQGRVDVEWNYVDDLLEFEWRERGAAAPPQPAGQGFGTRLLKAVARELDADVTSEIAPSGLTYRWRVKLGDKIADAR
jgi:two-component sensor histidine kinase